MNQIFGYIVLRIWAKKKEQEQVILLFVSLTQWRLHKINFENVKCNLKLVKPLTLIQKLTYQTARCNLANATNIFIHRLVKKAVLTHQNLWICRSVGFVRWLKLINLSRQLKSLKNKWIERISNEGKLEGKLIILKGTENNIYFENNILSKDLGWFFKHWEPLNRQ